jgi:hypothetical protein
MDDYCARLRASFTEEERAKYARLVDQFRAVGADVPEDWALSEVAENIPQLARYLVLRHLWRREIDTWTDDTNWIQDMIGRAERQPTGLFADAGDALRRLMSLGATQEDLGRLARYFAYSTVFGTLNTIDSGADAEVDDEYPGWTLMETTGPEEAVTGRFAGGLHESVLSMDPTGREGRPPA